MVADISPPLTRTHNEMQCLGKEVAACLGLVSSVLDALYHGEVVWGRLGNVYKTKQAPKKQTKKETCTRTEPRKKGTNEITDVASAS